MSQTIVITGGTGLIGKEIAKRLVARGDKVIMLVRDPEKAKTMLPDVSSFFKWDAYSETGDWIEGISAADAVIHLAGVPVAERWNDDYKKEIYNSRIISTRNLVRTMGNAANKPRVFLCGSAIGYYGNQGYGSAIVPLDESSPAASGFLAEVCVHWENEAFQATKFGIRTAAIRTGVVLSTKSGALEKMLTPFRLFAGGPIGDGRQWVSWIHIDDEVSLFLHALDHENVQGSYNGTAPNPVMMNEFAKTLGKVLSRPSLFSVPKAALELLFGEAASVIAEGQRVLPKKTLESGFKFGYQTLELAIMDILTHSK